MPYFTGIEIWTDRSCAASAQRVAFLDAGMREHLKSATLKQSLTNAESLVFSVPRRISQVAELVHGRVARVCWSDSTLDTEWPIADDEDRTGQRDTGEKVITCQAMMLDLARAPYVAFDSYGKPSFDFSATQLTATQWLTNYVLPACTEGLWYTVAVGTVEFTNTFDLNGEFANALEIIRAIQQPGRAPGDFEFKRNSATNYTLNLWASRGSTATTVRVQTQRNLLENARKRTLVNLGTKIVPRGAQGAATRNLSQTYWKVTVIDGTHFDLSDPYGGAVPTAFTDQLAGLYVARLASTFSSQAISASTTAGRCTVASTAGWSTGDFVRFFRTSGSAGERLISLQHPTRALSPANSGYGKVARILDMPEGFGDANLITSNAWMNTWTTAGNPADGWGRSSTLSGTWSRESTIIKIGIYSQKIANSTSGGQTETTRVYSPTATPYVTSGLRFSAHAWYRCDTVSDAVERWVRIRVMKPDLSVSYGDGAYVDPADNVGSWIRLSLSNLDLSAATAGVVVVVEVYVNNAPYNYAYHTSYFGPMGLGEADIPIADVLYNGGIAMWQRANTLLGSISSPVAGYQVRLADLARVDTGEWNDEPLVLGGSLEVYDTDLSDTTTQRVVELEQNLLEPLNAGVQLQVADPTITAAIAGAAPSSVLSGSTGTPVIAPIVQRNSLQDYGILDSYTKMEIDQKLAAFQALAGGQGNGAPLTIGGVTYTAGGNNIDVPTASTGAPISLHTYDVAAETLYEISGKDQSTNDSFVDLVSVDGTGTPDVGLVVGRDCRGTPRGRVYTVSSGILKLGLDGAGGNTYSIAIGIRKLVAV